MTCSRKHAGRRETGNGAGGRRGCVGLRRVAGLGAGGDEGRDGDAGEARNPRLAQTGPCNTTQQGRRSRMRPPYLHTYGAGARTSPHTSCLHCLDTLYIHTLHRICLSAGVEGIEEIVSVLDVCGDVFLETELALQACKGVCGEALRPVAVFVAHDERKPARPHDLEHPVDDGGQGRRRGRGREVCLERRVGPALLGRDVDRVVLVPVDDRVGGEAAGREGKGVVLELGARGARRALLVCGGRDNDSVETALVHEILAHNVADVLCLRVGHSGLVAAVGELELRRAVRVELCHEKLDGDVRRPVAGAPVELVRAVHVQVPRLVPAGLGAAGGVSVAEDVRVRGRLVEPAVEALELGLPAAVDTLLAVREKKRAVGVEHAVDAAELEPGVVAVLVDELSQLVEAEQCCRCAARLENELVRIHKE